MCSNLWAGFLRGRQLTDEDFKNVHRELRGFVPMPLRISGNRSWAVRLSAELPLEARFRNGLVTITLHIESWTTDGVWQQKAVSISASYRVEPEINMPRFVRDGDVQIVWHQVRADQPDPSSTQREFIRSKFDAFFARELYLDGLSAPVGNEWGPAAKLKIVASEIHSGWWRVIFKSDELNRLN